MDVLILFFTYFILGVLFLLLKKKKKIWIKVFLVVVLMILNCLSLKMYCVRKQDDEIATKLLFYQVVYDASYTDLLGLKERSKEYEEKIPASKIDELEKNVAQISQEMKELKVQEETKRMENDGLEKQLEELTQEYKKLLKENSILLKNVPTFSQYPKYPNGCESVALYILLKYYNVDVEVEDIVNHLKKGNAPYWKDKRLHGGNPEREFVGDPRNPHGYGVYQKPIIDVANIYKPGIKDLTGVSLSVVLKKVREGHPVQVWASINMSNTNVCTSWIDDETGQRVNWICNLHSLVVIGFNEKNIITSDPYTGKVEHYEKNQFEKMYNLFGKRAIYYE